MYDIVYIFNIIYNIYYPYNMYEYLSIFINMIANKILWDRKLPIIIALVF